MASPLEELKERLVKTWKEDGEIPGGEHCYCVELKDIADSMVLLAECYRKIAIGSCKRSLYIDSWKSQEEIVDHEASELFQERTK